MRVGLMISLIALSGTAHAEAGFPRWDMRTFCEGRVAAQGVDICVETQLQSRDKVKAYWTTVDKESRETCLEFVLNDDIPPSYMRLEHCLSLEARRR